MKSISTACASPNQPRTTRVRIAVISSDWHHDIVDRATQAVLAEIERQRPGRSEAVSFQVPGAFEIPLHAQRLALSGSFDAIVACGLVVNGGIYRHEFVASAVIDGLMRVQLDTGVPVFSAVLTPRDFHDHDEHRRFFADHFVHKGAEVARACLQTLDRRAAMDTALAALTAA
jgi:6,7-dimethyl-8-ribityllumazine synthase